MLPQSTIRQRVLSITIQLPYETAEVFRFWVTPRLLAEWASPTGMELTVSLFEPRLDGQYRFEHKNADGTWVTSGHIKVFERNQRLEMADRLINPQGRVIYQALDCIVEFKDQAGMTELHLRQRGFPTKRMMQERHKTWKESFDKLETLLSLEGSHHARKWEDEVTHDAETFM